MKVGIVSGKFKSLNGAVDHFFPVTVLRLNFEEGGEIEYDIPSNQNTLIYLLDGLVKINNQEATGKDFIWFNNDGEKIIMKANQKTRLILLAGEPIGEEVVSYGPFVMNTHTEVMEALRDAQMGKMGVLIEE